MKIHLTNLFAYAVFIFNRTTLPTYGMLAIVLGTLVTTRAIRKHKTNPLIIDGSFYIITALLSVWLYGFFLGFINGNNPSWVAKNFGGMVIYCIGYFILRSDEAKILIIRAIYICAIYVAIISIIIKYFLLSSAELRWILEMIFGRFSISYQHVFKPRITFTGHLTFYLPIILSYVVLIGSVSSQRSIQAIFGGNFPLLLRGRAMALFTLIIFVGILVFVNQGKGALLAIVVVISTYSFASTFVSKSGLQIKLIELIFLSLIFIFAVFSINYFIDILSESSLGNAKRYLQAAVLFDNITIFGHGLGAEVPGVANLRGGRGLDNSESEDLYAVELVYLNVFHKFGVFASVIIFSYLYVVVRAMIMIIQGETDLEKGFGMAALSMMGYTIVGLGNPLILGPAAIILHVVALRLVGRS